MSAMPSIHIDVQEHTAVVTLDRPPINSLVRDTYRELAAAFADVGSMAGVRVAVLRAAGQYFCPGNDVSEFAKIESESETKAYAQAVSDGISSVYDCKVPVVAAVHSHAHGAGMAIAACADVIVAASDATFAIPEIRVGVIGAAGFLELIVPEKVVRYMSLTGNPVSAGRIAEFGGIHAVVPAEDVFGEAMTVAKEISRNAPTGVRFFKEAMNINKDARLAEKYATESSYTARYIGSKESRESVAAFFEKREPNYD